jgi:hypothetical protein
MALYSVADSGDCIGVRWLAMHDTGPYPPWHGPFGPVAVEAASNVIEHQCE